MASLVRPPFGLAKRLKIIPPPVQIIPHRTYQSRQPWHGDPSIALEHMRDQGKGFDKMMKGLVEEARGVTLPARQPIFPPDVQAEMDELRLPRSVQLNYLRPLKRAPTHGVPSCDLQLRSYSARNLEFFADFALRAAYYLNLPARGPVPLPRIVQRWTVPRGNFVHKKSQENFERITMRRLVQIQDGHPEVVQIWLGFLQKYAYYGVGMKANVWEYSSLDVGKEMDEQAEKIKGTIDERFELFARGKGKDAKETELMMTEEVFKGTAGSLGPLGGTRM